MIGIRNRHGTNLYIIMYNLLLWDNGKVLSGRICFLGHLEGYEVDLTMIL
jgi:hypothetical protein